MNDKNLVAICTAQPGLVLGIPGGVWSVLRRDENGELSEKVAEFYSESDAKLFTREDAKTKPVKTGALCPLCGFETITSSVSMESFEDLCIERDRIDDDRSILLYVVKALVEFQQNYELNTSETAPGNDHYSRLLMDVVKQARAAMAIAERAK